MARYAEWNKFIGNLKTDTWGVTNVNEVGIAFDKATADVAPKSEVAKEILSDLKKTVHDKAIYTYSKELAPYVNLKVFDAVIADYLRRLEEKKYG